MNVPTLNELEKYTGAKPGSKLHNLGKQIDQCTNDMEMAERERRETGFQINDLAALCRVKWNTEIKTIGINVVYLQLAQEKYGACTAEINRLHDQRQELREKAKTALDGLARLRGLVTRSQGGHVQGSTRFFGIDSKLQARITGQLEQYEHDWLIPVPSWEPEKSPA